MIILHSHLQPQFKNELFHILHKKRNVRKSNSFKCVGSSSLRKQLFLLALRFVAEDVLRGMSEEKRLFAARSLIRKKKKKRKEKNQENLWDQGINYNVM